MASLVFPDPPGPVRVISRTIGSASISWMAASSDDLPKNSETWVGRLLGRASRVTGGGKSTPSPG